MAGPESIIPNIVEKVGDIDWAEFWKRLVGGVNPDEGLPVADEVAADGMTVDEALRTRGEPGGWDSPEGQAAYKEFSEVLPRIGGKASELVTLMENPPASYEAKDWIKYIEDLKTKERELVSLFEERRIKGLEMAQYGHYYDEPPDAARIQSLEDSIANLERIKAQLIQSGNPSGGLAEFGAFTQIANIQLEVQLELERLMDNLRHPQPKLVSAGG